MIQESDTTENRYLFDHTWDEERVRLTSLAAELDPGTFRHLDALGVGEGWTCLEVGAGTGSVARWLAERVGASGHVLATDLDTRCLDSAGYPNLEVRRHDILHDELPAERFDLVHVRWVLCWLPSPQDGLELLVSTLRPSGWLLAEEPDFVTARHASPAGVYRKVGIATLRVMESMSALNSEYGRRLFDDLRGQPLTDVRAEGRAPMVRGGQPHAGTEFLRVTIERLRAAIVAADEATDAEVEQAIALLDDPSFTTIFPMTMAGSGQPEISLLKRWSLDGVQVAIPAALSAQLSAPLSALSVALAATGASDWRVIPAAIPLFPRLSRSTPAGTSEVRTPTGLSTRVWSAVITTNDAKRATQRSL